MTILVLGVLAFGYGVALQPPAVRAGPTAAGELDTMRTLEVLRRVIGGEPHPIGSVAHGQVRDRIVAELTALGLPAEVQDTLAPGAPGVFARVQNVVARLDGQQDQGGLLLAAHYDSVPAAPGAADDGHAVALLLEVARFLVDGPRPRTPVVFLFVDGEELGLAGARAFVAEHRWFPDLTHVINLEARGTSGPSLMFETSSGNQDLVARFARVSARPFASSLFASVYERMPNDTDFSVYREHALEGYNFAFIGGVARYHSALDDLEHLDPRSLQHQGDNLLELTRSLAFEPASTSACGDAVYFDLFGRWLVRWPTWWTLPFATLFLVVSVLALRRRPAGGSDPRWARWVALGAWVVTLMAIVGVAQTFDRSVADVFGIDEPFVAVRAPFVAFYWLVSLAITVLVWSRLASGVAADIRWRVHGVVVALLAFVATAWDPRVSYPFLVLAGFHAVLVLPWLRNAAPPAPRSQALRFALSAVIAGVMAFPIAFLLVDALGVGLAGVLPPILIVLPTLPPLLRPIDSRSDRRATATVLALALAGLVAVVVATWVPHRDAQQPGMLNILYVADPASATAHWVVGDRREVLSDALAAQFPTDAPLPQVPGWPADARVTVGPAPYESSDTTPQPEIEVVESDRGADRLVLRVRLRSPGAAPVLSLVVSPKYRVVALEVLDPLPAALPPSSSASTSHPRPLGQSVHFHGLESRPIELRLTLSAATTNDPLELSVLETRYTLPTAGDALKAARGRDRVPKHRGDRSLTWKTIRPAFGH